MSDSFAEAVDLIRRNANIRNSFYQFRKQAAGKNQSTLAENAIGRFAYSQQLLEK